MSERAAKGQSNPIVDPGKSQPSSGAERDVLDQETAPDADPRDVREVRRARDGDLSSVKALLDGSGLPVAGLDQTDLWVAIDLSSKDVVGTGGLEIHGRSGLLRSLTVAPSARGRGLSRVLVDHIEDAARRINLDALYLITADAADYFRRLGWGPASRDNAPHELRQSAEWNTEICPSSADLMVKHLHDLDRDERHRTVRGHFTALARGERKAPPHIDAYDSGRLISLPDAAATLRLGVGPIVDFSPVRPGLSVLDIGCGSGLDALLCTRRLGDGSVVGIDLTPAMVDRARGAAQTADAQRVRFAIGDMEHLPLPERSFDLVIANASVSLTVDRAAALAEAHRVLRPGGHLMLADAALQSEPGPALRRDPTLVLCGLGGAATRDGLLALLERIGFDDVKLLREVAHPIAVGVPARAVIIRARRPTAP